ncbi:MAG: hypothetical protein R2705_22330 [Ilumatobacteraceae bacterium]
MSKLGPPSVADRWRAAGLAATVTIVVLLAVPTFDRINSMIARADPAVELALRAALVAWTIAVAVPLVVATSRRWFLGFLAISLGSAVIGWVGARLANGWITDRVEPIAALPMAVVSVALAVASVATAINLRRSSSPAVLAHRPHHWR